MEDDKYQPQCRKEGNEFSLRIKPSTVKHFQSGTSNVAVGDRDIQKSETDKYAGIIRPCYVSLKRLEDEMVESNFLMVNGIKTCDVVCQERNMQNYEKERNTRLTQPCYVSLKRLEDEMVESNFLMVNGIKTCDVVVQERNMQNCEKDRNTRLTQPCYVSLKRLEDEKVESNNLMAKKMNTCLKDDENCKNDSTGLEMKSDEKDCAFVEMLNCSESQNVNSDKKAWCNGCIVWGKYCKNWWPGVIFPGPMAGQTTAKPGWTWLMWFENYRIAHVQCSQIVKFVDGFKQYSSGKMTLANEEAILEALQICFDRAGININGLNNIKIWGVLEGGFLKLVESEGVKTDIFTPKPGSEFPIHILNELKKLRRGVNKCDSESDTDFHSRNEEHLKQSLEEIEIVAAGSNKNGGNRSDINVKSNNTCLDVEMNSDDRESNKDKTNFQKSGYGNAEEKLFCNGSIVWAKFYKNTWLPAIIFPGPMAGQKAARPGWTWLMWFQDYKISEIRCSHVVGFSDGFKKNTKGKLTSANEKAIIKALQICADRADISLNGMESVKSFDQFKVDFLCPESAVPKPGSEFPQCILLELEKLYREVKELDKSSGNQNEEFQGIKTFRADVYKDANFCLSCAKHGQKDLYQHPLFEGNICNSCKSKLLERLYVMDKDGVFFFCSVCGEAGKLYVCEKMDCGRTFCERCMRHYLTVDTLKLVQQKSPWNCFLCDKYSVGSHGALVPRVGWNDELVRFFNPTCDQVNLSPDPQIQPSRKLRVLSLFEGIGYVKLALDQLNLDIDTFYAVEDNSTARHISNFQFYTDVVNLGDFNSITKEKLKEICPIDLVVARPPTEDLDVTNEKCEGFNGTGIMILKVLNILKTLQILCQNKSTVYWLVETTLTMKSEYRKALSNFLEIEPCMWDAQFFSPLILPKYYWGNIPSLYSAFQYHKDNSEHVSGLDSYIMKNVDRSAQVKRLRSCAVMANCKRVKRDMDDPDEGVLSDSHSDMFDRELDSDFVNSSQGTFDGSSHDIFDEWSREGSCDSSNQDDNLCEDGQQVPGGSAKEDEEEVNFQAPAAKMNTDVETIFSLPVKMHGHDAEIWPTEVEKLLGLPVHFTDAAINVAKRQKELVRASSVDVLKHILSPLTEIFSTHT